MWYTDTHFNSKHEFLYKMLCALDIMATIQGCLGIPDKK